MSTLHPIAGEKIYIGGVLNDQATDFAAADFASQSWTLIDGWQQAGKIGDTAALISTDLINRGRTVKQKGTFNGGQMQNNFAIIANDPGQLALIAARQTTDNYAFRIVGTDTPAVVTLTGASMTAAAPGVVTKTAHGLVAGTPIKFTAGTGTLPTGIVDGTTYYVKTVVTADTFTVSATSGGTAITTTGSPSGTYTITTVPAPSERKFIALVMNTDDAGGTANTIALMNVTLEVNSNIVSTPALG